MSHLGFLVPLIAVLCFAGGILLAVGGYKLHVSFPFLPGLWSGAFIGAGTAGYLGLSDDVIVIAGAVAGAALAVLTLKRPKTGTFLVFFAGGYAPGGYFCVVLQRTAVEGSTIPLAGLIAMAIILAGVGTVFGLLATRFNPRMWIIIKTSLLGGLLAILPTGNMDIGLVSSIVLLLVIGGGIYVQLKFTGTTEGIAWTAQTAAPAARRTATAPAEKTVPAPAQPQAPAPAAKVVPAAAMTVCANCGMPLKPGLKFCPECGHPISQPPKASV